jgi:hypothetical protein
MPQPGRRLWGFTLALLVIAGSALAEEQSGSLAVTLGEEGPDSCQLMVSETMLSYACGERGGTMTSGVVLFPDRDSILLLVEGLRQTIAADPPDLPDESGASRDRFLSGLEAYEAAVKALAQELRAGREREESRPAFQHLHRARRDVILAAREWSPPVETVRRIAASAALLARLDRYYVKPASR